MEKKEKPVKGGSPSKDGQAASGGQSKSRFLKGIVVSDKMDKTIVVSVSRIKKHPKYKKRYKVNKKYKAHDEKNEFKIGDKVIIKESRPISKDKRWRVVNKI